MNEPVPVAAELEIPFAHVATFIRQVTHDVRNNLNAMDLQAAYAVELITDAEAVEEVRRIRQLIQQATKHLQALSGNFHVATPSLVTYSAGIFVEDLQDRLKKMFPDEIAGVEWRVTLGKENICVDLELIFTAMAELFRNAFQFREPGKKIEAHAFSEGGRFVFELIEEKSSVASDPGTWGQVPFKSTRRGGYGLGLYRTRRILDVHNGELLATHDSASSRLVTRVSFPLAEKESA